MDNSVKAFVFARERIAAVKLAGGIFHGERCESVWARVKIIRCLAEGTYHCSLPEIVVVALTVLQLIARVAGCSFASSPARGTSVRHLLV